MRLLSHLFQRQAPERRVRTIQVTGEALLGLFRLDGTSTLRMEGVPEDAKLETLWVESASQTLHIAISSSEFELVEEGNVPLPIYVSVYVTHQVPQEVH